MSAEKPTREQKLQARFNMAAYRCGILGAAKLIDDRCETALWSDIGAIDAIYASQQKLRYETQDSEKLVARLEKPMNQLKASFVRKVDAAIRRLDPDTLKPRVRRQLGL